MNNQSLSHSYYNCTYLFIPKYRRKVMPGDLRKDIDEAISKTCKMEGITIIKAAAQPDHVYMYVSIPPVTRREDILTLLIYNLREISYN